MKALMIVAGLFFASCGALAAWFAVSGGDQEYDLKLVLPIDAKQMPKPVLPPPAPPLVQGEVPAQPGAAESRAVSEAAAPVERPPFRFDPQASPASPRAEE